MFGVMLGVRQENPTEFLHSSREFAVNKIDVAQILALFGDYSLFLTIIMSSRRRTVEASALFRSSRTSFTYELIARLPTHCTSHEATSGGLGRDSGGYGTGHVDCLQINLHVTVTQTSTSSNVAEL